MTRSNQKGFAVIEALLVVVILALVGFTGWFVWHSKQSTNKTLNDASKSSQGTTSPKAKSPTSFTECKAAAASKILTTFPEQCVTKAGKTFTDTSQSALTIKEWGVAIQYSSQIQNPTYQFITGNKYLSFPTVALSTKALDSSEACQAYYAQSATADNELISFQRISRLQLTDKTSFDEGVTSITAEQAAQMTDKMHPNNSYKKVGNYVYHFQTSNGMACSAQTADITQAFESGFTAIAASAQ